MKKWFITIGLVALCVSLTQAAMVIDSSTLDWTIVTYGTNHPDAYSDQQTGTKSADLVGNASNAVLYTKFDNAGTPSKTDGTLAFRVRLAEAKNYSKLTFNETLLVGIDANRDGALDIFLAADNSPQGTGNLGIHNPGAGANTGPSTTTIVKTPLYSYTETATNFFFTLVTTTIDPRATSTDIDAGGKQDVFVSFCLPFGDIVAALGTKGISITEDSALNYVMATSTQINSLNCDLNGVAGGTTSTLTFGELGGVADTFSASGIAIPEPAAALLFGVGGMGVWLLRRNKNLTANEDGDA